MTWKRALWLWLLVIFVGIQFGAGWYEKLGVVPLWSEVPPDQVLSSMEVSGMYSAGRAFWPFVSPVVALLAVINLVAAWHVTTPCRRWWLAAASVMTVYALVSYAYFVPQMLMFQSDGDSWSADRVESFVSWWTALNYPRMALGALGWLCALKALSLSALPPARETSPAANELAKAG